MIAESLNIPKIVVLQVLKEDFCSRDFLLHDNAPAHKAASFYQFSTQKMLQPLSPPPPVLSRFISPDCFLLPKLKMELKGLHFVDVAEIQEAVTDEFKKVQKEEISANFQKLHDHAKVYVHICQWSLF
jgi:hypothetical protein